MDGDIIVFQKDERDDIYELPTCRDYFKWVLYVCSAVWFRGQGILTLQWCLHVIILSIRFFFI
jgi:hypothetical protein